MSGTPSIMRRTPLYEAHRRLGARFVPFAGWDMPLSFAGVLEEHRATRSAVGLFDISHMGRITVSGGGAGVLIARVCTASAENLSVGKMQYTLALNEGGGILDDLMVYRTSESRFLVCANASNADKIFHWLERQSGGLPDVKVADDSSGTAQIAVQGPRALEMIGTLTNSVGRMRPRDCMETEVAGVPAMVSRSGYTGEPGYEMYLHRDRAAELWGVLLKKGEAFGARPCGLGCRDTLRLEMGYPLYGNDMDETTSPMEASLEFAVDFEKPFFIGRDAVLQVRKAGPARKLVGFELTERGVPRHGQKILAEGKEAGIVTSGNHSPSLNKGIGMGFVPPAFSKTGQKLSIDIRGREVPAVVVSRPFYKKKT